MRLPRSYHSEGTIYNVRTGDFVGELFVTDQAQVKCLVQQAGEYARESFNIGGEPVDVVAWLEPENEWIRDYFYNLQGMYFFVDGEWYRIEKVNVHRSQLLNNRVDNVELLLNKSKELELNES